MIVYIKKWLTMFINQISEIQLKSTNGESKSLVKTPTTVFLTLFVITAKFSPISQLSFKKWEKKSGIVYDIID